MLIPYNTDAPIYHWPFATLGTIIVNVVVFVFLPVQPESQPEWLAEHFILVYGHWNPLQWITSNYLHGSLMHLIGNLVVLWGIGIVVEGKIGWWRFLVLYNLIGLFQCGVEQTLMVFAKEGGSFGASAIIYGLIAIALVWAPRNELNCVLLWGRFTTFDLPVATYAGISIGIEVALGIFTAVRMSASEGSGVAMSSQVLHLMGAATGFAIGAAMVKWNWVDCENWDLFSVMRDRHLMTREQLAEEALNSDEAQEKFASLEAKAQDDLRRYLAAGEAEAALAVHRRGRKQFPAWRLNEDDHIQLISSLRAKSKWDEAIETMVEFLKTPQPKGPVVRLALAQLLIEQLGRPGQALKVIARLDPGLLPPKHQAALSRLRERAERARENDPFEVTVDDW